MILSRITNLSNRISILEEDINIATEVSTQEHLQNKADSLNRQLDTLIADAVLTGYTSDQIQLALDQETI